ncbi:peroxide stress protein YaaA [Lacimicrobium alkaliphilum]|uniref:UPF0246 protein GCM10011357_01880 n=1 Tax=Lacimicrobium alkaliphilum TaxID=1526571 RepID=A0ABQ1QZW5_9ALTE|nr:peroxide stress protein YaaA [Lacimicrobium alkaliphilum]GGD49540.1 UPF0246 protein [Lacimicrobium alkaliphilum]
MLIVLSPAKNLDYDTPAPINTHSQPEMLDDASELIQVCRGLSPQQVSSLMKISDKLAHLNVERYHNWSRPFTVRNAKQSLLAFNGDVYTGLEAQSLSEAELDYAQKHLRILSGLYGLLKPLDLMQPYRLEMGTRLDNARGKDLYQFWGDKITEKLNQSMQAQGDNVLVNLASNEYFKSVRPNKLEGAIVTPVFKDQKNGKYKVISFYAKKARGMMARYIIQNQIREVKDLQGFDTAGYRYAQDQSSQQNPVFIRDEQ